MKAGAVEEAAAGGDARAVAARPGHAPGPPSAGMSLHWRGDRLTCRVRGCTRLDTLDAHLVQVGEACRQRRVAAVLVDLTDTDDLVSAGDRVRLGFRLAQSWPPWLPMAVLVRPEMHLPDRTFEHVACHRGLRVRSFSDRTQAWRWLAHRVREAPPGDPVRRGAAAGQSDADRHAR